MICSNLTRDNHAPGFPYVISKHIKEKVKKCIIYNIIGDAHGDLRGR